MPELVSRKQAFTQNTQKPAELETRFVGHLPTSRYLLLEAPVTTSQKWLLTVRQGKTARFWTLPSGLPRTPNLFFGPLPARQGPRRGQKG